MSNSRRRFFAASLISMAACRSRDRVHVETDEGPSRLAAMLPMSDEADAAQLLDGFYNLEDKRWRWTSGHFSVLLRPPLGAAENGAVLKVELNIPQPLLDHVKTTALKATIRGTSFTPESFTQAGSFTFARDVPASLLDDDAVKVDFSMDRFLAAGTVDGRELGLVVTAIGFEPHLPPR